MTEDDCSGIFHVEFSGDIIGGPHDGARLHFKGVSPTPDVLQVMGMMEYDGHKYTIETFDRAKSHAMLKY